VNPPACKYQVNCVNVHRMISWIALNMVEGLKPIHKASLLKEFGSAEKVLRAGELELTSVPEIKAEIAYRIAHFDLKTAEKECREATKLGFEVISLDEARYPVLLKNIPDPPLVLYVKGSILPDEPAVALVGSRKATPYGLNVTQFLARDLAAAGVTVVSGLARGIDARAHNACLQAGARTIAVLGSGVNVIYPSEHKSLAENISQQGAVLSEFPLGTPPNRENFPIRNRIISGLSHAVVIVEASRKSGSLITARMAAEQGREVLAVPGSIFNESSQGSNLLIKDGAALVQSWRDVVENLPEEFSRHIYSRVQNEGSGDPELTDLEKAVVTSLSFEEPRHVDQIAVMAGLAARELLGALVSLELKNYVSQMHGKQYIRMK
jgi:DNA processing protein